MMLNDVIKNGTISQIEDVVLSVNKTYKKKNHENANNFFVLKRTKY